MAGKEALKEQQKKLEQQERTTGRSGAVPLTPKNELLYRKAAQIAEANPDKHYRMVNTRKEQEAKVIGRQAEGYVKVAEGDGGHTVGDLALFEQPREKYDEKIEAIESRNEELLRAHDRDVEQTADAIARQLRDRHGINVSAEDILVRER